MKIREFQTGVAELINGIEELVQGGCKAFAEDSLTIQNDVKNALTTAAGVAIAVTTPELTRNGDAADCIPCDSPMVIKVMEMPALNRANPGHLTVMDAAEIIARELDDSQFGFNQIRQTVDERSGILTAEINFSTTITF